jgi:hypothetical protein
VDIRASSFAFLPWLTSQKATTADMPSRFHHPEMGQKPQTPLFGTPRPPGGTMKK